MKMPKKNRVVSLACVSSFVLSVGATPSVSAVEALSDGELQQSYLSIVTASKVEEPVKKAENKCQANADKNANFQQDMVRDKKHQSACGEGSGDNSEEDAEKEKLSAKKNQQDKKKSADKKTANDGDDDSLNASNSQTKKNKASNDGDSDNNNANANDASDSKTKAKTSSGSGSVSVSNLNSVSESDDLEVLGITSTNDNTSTLGANTTGVGNGLVAGNDLNQQTTNTALHKAQSDILNANGNSTLTDRQSADYIQKQLSNLQNAQVNSDATGTTVTIGQPSTINFDYLYRSINGGGINKGTDIEIPSIRAGYTELKIRTYK